MAGNRGSAGRKGLVDLSADDVLAFAEAQHAERLQAERNILRAAYQWAVLHSPDRLPESDKRGRERAKPARAAETPLITEYAAATFGARIQTSPFGAKKLIARRRPPPPDQDPRSLRVRQPFPGIIVWRDPHYLVDNTGSRKVAGNNDPPRAA